MLENNYHVGDFPDIWFYKCVIWTNESKDIPEIITTWATPNGLTVEPTPFIGLQVHVEAIGATGSSSKGKDKELIPMHAAESHEDSDAEGSAARNFIGLKPPERKRKPGRPTTSRDKLPYDDRGAKSKKLKDATNGKAPDGSGTSKHTRFCSICRGAGHKRYYMSAER
uniref:Uncharacterized protein n=1 Tax=Triticum urartu TaxID=4572 RepID=A0A8R7PIT0_TRIUA